MNQQQVRWPFQKQEDRPDPTLIPSRPPSRKALSDHACRKRTREIQDHLRQFFTVSVRHFEGDDE